MSLACNYLPHEALRIDITCTGDLSEEIHAFALRKASVAVGDWFFRLLFSEMKLVLLLVIFCGFDMRGVTL